MVHLFYIFLLLFLSTFCELFFGSYGIIIPFLGIIIFYLTTVYNLKLGIVLAVIVGFLLDILYARTFYISSVTLCLISLFAIFWLRKGVVKHIHLQVLPGCIIASIYAIPVVVINYFMYENGFLVFFINIMVLLVAMILTAILLPAIIFLLDGINTKLKINLYTDSKKRFLESS